VPAQQAAHGMVDPGRQVERAHEAEGLGHHGEQVVERRRCSGDTDCRVPCDRQKREPHHTPVESAHQMDT